jgi:hypothetical protein
MSKNKPKLILPQDNKASNLVRSNGAPLIIKPAQAPEKVFLGTPTRTGQLSGGTAQAVYHDVTKHRIALFRLNQFTNLECNYNMLLCDALNLRDHDGIVWFAMLHDDVNPEPFWLDTLIDEALTHDADLMSAHVPLKDMRGYTSTAMSDPDCDWIPFVRFTLKQIHHELMPPTLDTVTAIQALRDLPEEYRVECPAHSQLLTNTGCMVMRVDRPWMDHICFHKHDSIVYEGGSWQAMTWTEDWLLAQDLQDAGAKVMATRKVNLSHWDGRFHFNSKPLPSQHAKDITTIETRAGRLEAKATALKLLESTADDVKESVSVD